jgi:protein SCO1
MNPLTDVGNDSKNGVLRLSSPKRRHWLGAAALASLLTGCDKLGIGGSNKPQFVSIDITGADYAQGFALSDYNGKPRSLAEFKGKVVVVFFGFVQCPDVCPTTLAELAEVKKLLGDKGEKLQTVFITVDPERDTPEVLKAYLGAFDANAVGLIPNAAQLAQVSKDFKVYHRKEPGQTPTSYTVSHTTHAYIFDASGRIRLVSRYGSGAKALAGDVALLM